ncbi:MAG: hypothetical protein IPO27_11260 [Bacteroidetes bacterium]|nr:hypothetical protein [Bacteroidota bacterium]
MKSNLLNMIVMKRLLIILLISFSASALNAQTWIQLQTPNTRNLYGCWFDPAQPDTGMAVGWFIQNFDRLPFGFYTNDGGATITSGSLFQTYFYASSDVWFTNSYNGIVVGNGIIQTTNGGSTWNLVVDATATQAGILENVMFTNSTNGYAVGQRYDFSYTSFEGMLYKTTNAGGSWTDYTVSQEVSNENTLLHTVFCTGNGVVYAGAENTLGGSTLFKSTDDGITWSPISFTQSIWSLYFVSMDTGFAATANGLYQTTNAGLTWNQALPTTSALHTIQIKNGFGFTAGENGIIYMTNDNGKTWVASASPVTATISDVSVISPNLAYAVGAAGTFLKYTNTVGVNELNLLNDLVNWIDDNHQLNLKWNNNLQSSTTIEILNTSGSVLKKVSKSGLGYGQQNIQIDLTSFPNGVYLINFIQEKLVTNKKFVLIK